MMLLLEWEWTQVWKNKTKHFWGDETCNKATMGLLKLRFKL